MRHSVESVGSTPSDPSRPRPRLLVIDDESVFRTIIEKIAKQVGFVVTKAASVLEAEKILAGHAFDAITLDLLRGTGFGIDVLRSVADAGCRTSIVIVSGSPNATSKLASSVGRMLKLKISGVLVKPIDFEHLRSFPQQIEQEFVPGPARCDHARI